MGMRVLWAAMVLCSMSGEAWGQAGGPASQTVPAGAWGLPAHSPQGGPGGPAYWDGSTVRSGEQNPLPAGPSVHVSAGSGTLPNEQGQVWREYDISTYTSRVTTTKRPEQAVVDWILRETGYEAWHGEPLAILSVTPRTLRVYHTPQMHAVVADLVERFIASQTLPQAVSFRIVSVDSPNWRARAQRVLRPVPLQTSGAAAWLMAKEEAALLLADLGRRNDYREHSSSHLLVSSGQSTVVSQMRARAYVHDILPRPGAWPGFENRPGQVEEGFSLELSPLLCADCRTIDATIRCNIDQVDRFVPVLLDLPVTNGSKQRAKLDVPQMTHFRFHERFRWPVDQVLLVSMGMVGLAVPLDGKPPAAGVALPLLSTPPRADLLVFVQSQGLPPSANAPPAIR